MHLSLLVQPPAVGGDPFGIPTSGGERAPSDPFGGGGGSHDNSKTPPSSDPFADPFGSDSFGSAGWSGDSLAATAPTAHGVSSSTPKGTKIPKVCTCVSAHYYCVAEFGAVSSTIWYGVVIRTETT